MGSDKTSIKKDTKDACKKKLSNLRIEILETDWKNKNLYMHKGLQFEKLIEENSNNTTMKNEKNIIYNKYKVKARLELLYDTMDIAEIKKRIMFFFPKKKKKKKKKK